MLTSLRSARRPLKQAHALIADKGVFAENWFIHTPVCCPSRAELLSGRYFHNLRMPGPSGGCMHVQTSVPGVDDKPNDHSFAIIINVYFLKEIVEVAAGGLQKSAKFVAY